MAKSNSNNGDDDNNIVHACRQAEDLRRQLEVSNKTAGEVTADQKRLLTELEATKGVTEERNRLQQRFDRRRRAVFCPRRCIFFTFLCLPVLARACR